MPVTTFPDHTVRLFTMNEAAEVLRIPTSWLYRVAAVAVSTREIGPVQLAARDWRSDVPQHFWRKRREALQIGMSPNHLLQNHPTGGSAVGFALLPEELPLTVREAAVYLGVSIQTVYLWVERKQIPHLRVMGRNIRFLKSDLQPFRATFKQEVGIGKTE